ncbi:hypothetical protein [Vibrio proteolyticus]|nr:hypothetical protein [Vibrio proteolyticus]
MDRVHHIKVFFRWFIQEVLFKFKGIFFLFIVLVSLSAALEGLTLILISDSHPELINKIKTVVGLNDFNLSLNFSYYLTVCITIWCISSILHYLSCFMTFSLWKSVQVNCANNILNLIPKSDKTSLYLVPLLNKLQHLGALVRITCNSFAPILRFVVFSLVLLGISTSVTLTIYLILSVVGGMLLFFMSRSSSMASKYYFKTAKDNNDELRNVILDGNKRVGTVYQYRIDLLLKRFNRSEQIKLSILIIASLILIVLINNPVWIGQDNKTFIIYLITLLFAVKQLANISSIFTAVSRYYPSFLEYNNTRRELEHGKLSNCSTENEKFEFIDDE